MKSTLRDMRSPPMIRGQLRTDASPYSGHGFLYLLIALMWHRAWRGYWRNIRDAQVMSRRAFADLDVSELACRHAIRYIQILEALRG